MIFMIFINFNNSSILIEHNIFVIFDYYLFIYIFDILIIDNLLKMYIVIKIKHII